MTVKLTLSIDEEVIVSAKQYAEEKGKSLSGIVENYLKSISNQQSGKRVISPEVKKLMGTLKLDEDFNYKDKLKNEMLKKYSS